MRSLAFQFSVKPSVVKYSSQKMEAPLTSKDKVALGAFSHSYNQAGKGLAWGWSRAPPGSLSVSTVSRQYQLCDGNTGG